MCLWRAGSAQHERLQARVEDVRRDGVHELHFQQLWRFDFVHAQPPAVHLAQVDLLPVFVVAIQRGRAPRRRGNPRRDSVAARAPRCAAGPRPGCVPSTTARRQFERATRRASGATRRDPRACTASVAGSAATDFGFPRQQMLKESRRPAHRLARVVEDVVEARQPLGRNRVNSSTLGVWRRSSPWICSRSRYEAKSGSCEYRSAASTGKARRDDDVRAGAQQFERRLVADLDPRARDQRVVAAEIGGLLALGVVEVAARLAHRIVVAMHLRERLLADVAVAFLVQARPLVEVFRLRRLEPQRRKYRRAALDAQPGLLDAPCGRAPSRPRARRAERPSPS